MTLQLTQHPCFQPPRYGLLSKISAAALCLASLFSSLGPASAQNWPEHPIHLFVSQGAGGGQGSIAHYLADAVSANLRQTIVIENRPRAESDQELRAFVRDEIALWGKMISDIGLEAQ